MENDELEQNSRSIFGNDQDNEFLNSEEVAEASTLTETQARKLVSE